MSRVHQLSVAGTTAAVLVAVLSIVSFRSDDEYARSEGLLALPFVVILVLILAYVVFRCLVPLADLLLRPDIFGLGMSVLSLLLLLMPFWFGAFSIDWGLFSGMSIVMSVGGASVGEIAIKRSDKPVWAPLEDIDGPKNERLGGAIWSYLAIFIGVLVAVANFAAFVLDILVV
jgi:hypothetical protein